MARSALPLMRLSPPLPRSALPLIRLPRSFPPSPASSFSRLFITAKSLPTTAPRFFLFVLPPSDFKTSSCFESEDSVYLRVLMPGVAREDVEVHAEPNKVVIRATRKKKPYEEVDTAHMCDFGIQRPRGLSTDALKLNEMKAVMNNGILKVVIPKAPNWREFL